MNGSTLTKAFVSLPGGVQAVYNSSGLQYFRHPDWLGSSRLSTTTSRTKYYDVAYAPFGEPYSGSGTQDLSFTGQNQDTESSQVPGGAGGLYDFLYREHSPVQGRWLSPDPAGLAAANPSDPQTWNRYAYVGNRPLNSVDSLGLCDPDDPSDPSCYCDPSDASCYPCDPNIDCGDPVDCGGLPCPVIPPNSPVGYPPSFTNGSIDPNMETTNLPWGLNTSPLSSLAGLLGLLPGLGCGGNVLIGTGFVATGGPSGSTNPCNLVVVASVVLPSLEASASSFGMSWPKIRITTTYWGPPAIQTPNGCHYTMLACSTGIPTCKSATPAIGFTEGCPSYVKGQYLVYNGTCEFEVAVQAQGPGPCD